MTDGRLDIMNMVERMPAFPISVHRVVELTSDINADPKELVAIIEHDPVLLMRILKLANSPYFRLSQKITSVNHAVVIVGFNTVKNMALSIAAIGVLRLKTKSGFDMEGFLLHALSTATIARLFAKNMRVPTKASFDYFVSGLLHDYGKIVFAHFKPLDFQRALIMAREKGIPLHEAEKEIFNIDHAQVGSILGEKWNLPSNLLDVMKTHHSQDCARLLLTDVVSASNQIGKELKIGEGGNPVMEKIPDQIAGMFGADVEGIVGALGDVRGEIEQAMVFATM
jgi:HD-like signal output (HDOD) protein